MPEAPEGQKRTPEGPSPGSSPPPKGAGAGGKDGPPGMNAVRFMGVGLQFAATVGLFAWAGYWLDGKYGWEPWAVTVSTLLGVGTATYHLLKETA